MNSPRKLDPSPSPSPPRVAVIGAGIAGLLCAQSLQAHGVSVQIFDKSRGVGGRMATRRAAGGETFDHGAQYFTARDVRFAALVNAWEQAGCVAPWQGKIVSLSAAKAHDCEPLTRYVGTPAMTAIAKHLARELQVTPGVRIVALQRGNTGWQLIDDAGHPQGEFTTVLIAVPPEQAAPLVTESQLLTSAVQQVAMQPSWAVMATFAEPVVAPFDGAFVQDSPLGWLARNNSKPGRSAQPETWVLHATSAWSVEHLEQPAEAIIDRLFAAVRLAWPSAPWQPTQALAHRWRYALPQQPLPSAAYFDPTTGLGICGDWCGGPRVEGAALSGLALGEQVLQAMRS